jgi:hypothetical protein
MEKYYLKSAWQSDWQEVYMKYSQNDDLTVVTAEFTKFMEEKNVRESDRLNQLVGFSYGYTTLGDKLLPLIQKTLDAWNTLPAYSKGMDSAVEHWLDHDMTPVVNELRAAIKEINEQNGVS